MHHLGRWLCGALLCAAARAAVPTLGALELARPVEVTVPADGAVQYTVAIDAPGMVTAVTRGSGGDLAIELRDADNQVQPGGTVDNDAGGVLCDEQLVVAVPYAATWKVRLRNYEQKDAVVRLVVGWLPLPEVAAPLGPHGRPSLAAPIEPGANVEGKLDARAGQRACWYQVTPAADGRLALFTKGDKGLDLSLKVVVGEDWETSVAESDLDQDGQAANEGLSFPVKAGSRYYVRVLAVERSQGTYRFGTSLAPF